MPVVSRRPLCLHSLLQHQLLTALCSSFAWLQQLQLLGDNEQGDQELLADGQQDNTQLNAIMAAAAAGIAAPSAAERPLLEQLQMLPHGGLPLPASVDQLLPSRRHAPVAAAVMQPAAVTPASTATCSPLRPSMTRCGCCMLCSASRCTPKQPR